MKVFDFLVRFFYGVLFILFGAGKWVPFLAPPAVSGDAAFFVAALIYTDFVWGLVGIVEIMAGILLVIGRAVPLAWVILAPIVAVIVPYLTFITGNGVPSYAMAAVHVFGMGFLLYRNWRKLLPLLDISPGGGAA